MICESSKKRKKEKQNPFPSPDCHRKQPFNWRSRGLPHLLHFLSPLASAQTMNPPGEVWSFTLKSSASCGPSTGKDLLLAANACPSTLLCPEFTAWQGSRGGHRACPCEGHGGGGIRGTRHPPAWPDCVISGRRRGTRDSHQCHWRWFCHNLCPHQRQHTCMKESSGI